MRISSFFLTSLFFFSSFFFFLGFRAYNDEQELMLIELELTLVKLSMCIFSHEA